MVHCRNVPPDVRNFFQRDIDRAKKATADRARERLRREKAAAEGNYPGDEEDEEAQVQRAMDLSRAEAEFRRGVEHIVWTPCLAHTVNLMLKDIARRPEHSGTIKQCKANF